MTASFATFDPSKLGTSLELEQSNTVLTYTGSADMHRMALVLEPKSSGTASAEVLLWGDASITNAVSIGVTKSTAELDKYVGETASSFGYRVAEGAVYNADASIETVTVGDKGKIIGVYLDLSDSSAPVATWTLDGVALTTQALPDTGPWYLAVTLSGTTGYDLRAMVNTGQRAFEFGASNRIGWIAVTDSGGSLRIGERGYISAASDALPNMRYRGAMAGDSKLTIRRSLNFWPWRTGSSSSAQSARGELALANADGAYDGLLTQDMRDAQVRVLDSSDGTVDNATVIADMLIEEPRAQSDAEMSLSLSDPIAQLDAALQNRLVRPDADESVANALWPISLGAVRSIEPLTLDGENLVFALHDGAVLGLGAVRTSGDKLDPTATPPDYTLDAQGLLTLESPPQGKVTADLSSTGGDVPGGPVDVLSGDGDMDTPTDWSVSAASGGITGGQMVLRYDSTSAPVYTSYAKHATWTPDASKLYRIVFDVINCSPQKGATGTKYDGATVQLCYGSTTSPGTAGYAYVIGSASAPGTYQFVFEPHGTLPFWLLLPTVKTWNTGSEAVLTPASVTIDNLRVYEISTDPVDDESLIPMPLEDLMRELIEQRAQWSQSTWSATDAAAIDTATGYAGIGFHAKDATTIAAPMRQALDSYWACAYRSRAGVIRFARMIAPESVDAGDRGSDITINDMLSDLVPTPDYAPGLTTQIAGRKNWVPLQPSEIVTDTTPITGVPLAERAMLGRDYRLSAVYSGVLPGSLAHARYAPAVGTLLDKAADIQAFADYVGTIYPASAQRTFYSVQVTNIRRFELGETRLLVYPRYGLSAGKPVLVVDITEELVGNTGTLILWG